MDLGVEKRDDTAHSGETASLRLAQQKSVEHLQSLYSAVVGLGLAAAMARIVNVGDSGTWQEYCVLFAYMATLLPFYHGAQRHLDENYVIGAELRSSGLLFGDFAILFVESATLFAMANSVNRPVRFAVASAILLAVDMVWGAVFTRRVFGSWWPSDRPDEHRWAIINLVTFPVLTVLALLAHKGSPEWIADPGTTSILVAIILTGRSAIDYSLTWTAYFPSPPSDAPKRTTTIAPGSSAGQHCDD